MVTVRLVVRVPMSACRLKGVFRVPYTTISELVDMETMRAYRRFPGRPSERRQSSNLYTYVSPPRDISKNYNTSNLGSKRSPLYPGSCHPPGCTLISQMTFLPSIDSYFPYYVISLLLLRNHNVHQQPAGGAWNLPNLRLQIPGDFFAVFLVLFAVNLF